MPIQAYLMMACGLCWTAAYLLLIRRAHRDKTPSMALAALACNISWEFIYAFLLPHSPIQTVINRAWFGLDVVLLYQVLRYTRFTETALLRSAPIRMALALAVAYPCVYFMGQELHDPDGRYSAFGMSLMMSILFFQWGVSGRTSKGQCAYATCLRLVGSVCADLAFYIEYPESRLLLTLYLATFAFDAAYLATLVRRPSPGLALAADAQPDTHRALSGHG